MRAVIQATAEFASALAERFGSLEDQKTIQWIVFPTDEQTACKWKHRGTVHDRCHTPHRLQTILTPPQQAVAVGLRAAADFRVKCLPALSARIDAGTWKASDVALITAFRSGSSSMAS